MKEEYSYNPQYLLKNGKPWFPVMGEMHYSRNAKKYWKESLYKMKAGGVDVVSTYVIWIHHEEIENEYDFEGNKDLKTYVRLCKECGLKLMLRIGPWSHGEVRNGGFPDWLLAKDFEVRTNNKEYFAQVRKFYEKTYEQVNGLFLKDGGPIIGVQIENEYGHCGGLNGEDGEYHMRKLLEIAKEIGYEVPLYTATGWGGAVTGGMIPVMGGYCDAPWDQRLTKIEPSGNYIFTHERNDHNIGSDFGFGTGITFDIDKFPYLTAELGGGMQVTHHRRIVASACDIGAMSMVKLGSGVNLLGYYMYHGGTNPDGKKTTLQESKETGSINDLSVLNYDFRAAVREYGQISDTFLEIKLLSTFIHDFGEDLCGMLAHIPEDNPLFPENLTDIRSSVRHNGKSGYLFVNNYQRSYPMAEHSHVNLSVSLPEETIIFKERDVKNGDYFFYPFNMELEKGVVLKTAMATPYCILDNKVKTYVFYTDSAPQYEIIGEMKKSEMLTLSRNEALHAWKINCGSEHLVLAEGAFIQEGNDILITVREQSKNEIKVYPAWKETPNGLVKVRVEGIFTIYKSEVSVLQGTVAAKQIDEDEKKTVYDLDLSMPDKSGDYFLHLTYKGDRAELYLDGKLIADEFYAGEVWEVGMRNFDFPKKLTLVVYPLYQEAKVYFESPVLMDGEKICLLEKVVLEQESHKKITILDK